MPKLTIYLPDREPMKVGFEDQVEVNIGRANDNDISVPHESMSGHHAQLKLVGDHYVLVDLDSTNGTFLDGAPISQVPLHNGARITFGRVEADFECPEMEGAASDEADAFGGDFGGGDSGGSGYESSIHATIAAQSLRPAGFKNLSPVDRVEKKDGFAKVAMLVGIVGLLGAAAVAAFAHMMKL
jgi:hypothetical protein